MNIWLALLASPSLALAAQTTMFALVTPSCSVQTRIVIHLVALGTLSASLLFTAMAWAQARRLHAGEGDDSDAPDRATSRRFLATTAAAVGLISSLVILAMWMAAWVLSPCWS